MWYDLILIVAIALWTLRIAIIGAISAEHAALVMVGLVILFSLMRGKGGRLLSALLTIFGVIVFIVWYGGGNEEGMYLVGGYFLAIVIVLIGFYVMFRGFRRPRSATKRCDGD